MDLQNFSDVSTRLEPLRRFLTDIDMAAKLVVEAQRTHQELATSIDELAAHKQNLVAEVAFLQEQRDEAQGQLGGTLDAIAAKVAEKEEAARLTLQTLQTQVTEAQQIAQEKLTRLHTQYDLDLQRLQAATAQAKAEFEATQEALRAISVRLKDLA